MRQNTRPQGAEVQHAFEKATQLTVASSARCGVMVDLAADFGGVSSSIFGRFSVEPPLKVNDDRSTLVYVYFRLLRLESQSYVRSGLRRGAQAPPHSFA